MDIANRFDFVEQMKQYRCGDVVGQITHNAQIRTQRGEIKDQCITGVNRHLCTRVFFLQAGNQVPIKLNHVQMSRALQQWLRQGAEAWANFYDALARTWIHCIHNAMNNALID